jgi:hypothetical protein
MENNRMLVSVYVGSFITCQAITEGRYISASTQPQWYEFCVYFHSYVFSLLFHQLPRNDTLNSWFFFKYSNQIILSNIGLCHDYEALVTLSGTWAVIL